MKARLVVQIPSSSRTNPFRVWAVLGVAVLLVQTPAVRAQVAPPAAGSVTAEPAVAPPVLAEGRIVLTAEQSAGGNLLKTSSGALIGVTLDKSCEGNFKKLTDACVEWKLATPLPAGWWRGTVTSNFRAGYANRDFGIQLMSGQNPSVPVAPNFINWEKDKPQIFEFWIYTSEPATSVRIQPTGDLWRWNNSWPVSQITLEQKTPAALTAADAVALDLPAQADGSLPLPMELPPGNWSMTGVVKTAGAATVEGGDKRVIRLPLAVDRYKRPSTVYFFADATVSKIALSPGLYAKPALLRHNVIRPSAALTSSTDVLTVTVDPARTESARLVLTGSGLTG